jgi:transcriptional enhancer factor
MILPTRVLPSNAPPLQEDNGVQHASRVLQEHSGNRQLVDFNNTDEYQPKYPSSGLTDSSYPRHHVLQPTQHVYRSQPQYRPTYRHGYGRPGYRCYMTPQEEAKLQYEAERLYRRFRQSDQYIKYRARQSKDDKGNGDQKWPDHLEKAFFRGTIRPVVPDRCVNHHFSTRSTPSNGSSETVT